MLCASGEVPRFPFLAKARVPRNATSATATAAAKKTRAASSILNPSDNDS